jgi:hypothetical protein
MFRALNLHRGALSTLYYAYMPSLVPARGRDQIALRRPAAPPRVAPPPLEVGPKEASHFARSLVDLRN